MTATDGIAGFLQRIGQGVQSAVEPAPLNGPADLSDLNRGQRGVLGVLSALQTLDGERNTQLNQLIAQRLQMADRNRKIFAENLGVLGKIGEFLDSVPIQERDQRAKELRQRYETEFGGANSGRLFDAVLGDPAKAPGMLQQLGDDPEIQKAIAGGANFDEIDQLRKSAAFQQRAQERQDVTLLPTLERKIQGLLGSEAPAIRERIQRITSDGKITVDEIRQLNEVAGQGSEGFQLSPAELETLARRQQDIAQRVPGFTTSKDFEESREDERSFEKFAREEALRQKGRRDLKGSAAVVPKPPTETSQLSFARETNKVRTVYRETASQIRRAVESPLTGVGDIQSLYQFIARQDNTAAREGELALAQRAASTLGRLQRIAGNITDGRLLDDRQRSQMREVLQEMLTDTQELEKTYALSSAEVAKNFGIDPRKIVPDLEKLTGIEVSGPQPSAERRRARTPDGREITVERGSDGKWHEVAP